MFPSNSYTSNSVNEFSNLNTYSISINNNEIRFKLLDFFLNI